MASNQGEVVPLRRVPSAEELQAAMAVLAAAGMVVAPSPAARRAGYMRVWIDREQEIASGLRDLTGSWLLCMHVLRQATATLPLDGQRMGVTQAELAEREGLTPAQVSRAFKALAEVGAVLLPRPEGKSKTWEVDAEYASRLPDAENRRQQAIERQRQEVARDRAVAARKAVAAGVKLREVPIEAPSRVEDAAQPELL